MFQSSCPGADRSWPQVQMASAILALEGRMCTNDDSAGPCDSKKGCSSNSLQCCNISPLQTGFSQAAVCVYRKDAKMINRSFTGNDILECSMTSRDQWTVGASAFAGVRPILISFYPSGSSVQGAFGDASSLSKAQSAHALAGNLHIATMAFLAKGCCS